MQLEIPFDYEEEKEDSIRNEEELNEETSGSWSVLTDEQLEDLYKYDKNEPRHQRI